MLNDILNNRNPSKTKQRNIKKRNTKISVTKKRLLYRRNKEPDKLYDIPNPDKKFHESWIVSRDKTTGEPIYRNPLDVIVPFRIVSFGGPNSGKSFINKHILRRKIPPFDKLTVIHEDIPDKKFKNDEGTKEYNDCLPYVKEMSIMGNIPPRGYFNRNRRDLVILDDLDYSTFNKEQLRRLSRLMGTWSTHRNCSTIVCAQRFFNLPACVRDLCNFWILWPSDNKRNRKIMAHSIGLSRTQLNRLFDLCQNEHDSIWIDRTDMNTPYKYRLNGFDILDIKKI